MLKVGRRLLRAAFLALLISQVMVAFAAPPAGKVTVTVTDAAVRIEGVTPKGSISLLTTSYELRELDTRLSRRYEQLTDDDGDGVVTLTLKEPLPPFALCVAVDETDGRFAVATPGYKPREMKIGPADFKINDHASPHAFEHRMAAGEAMLVRPGQGVWTAALHKPGKSPGADPHALGLDFKEMTFRNGKGNGPAAPERLAHDDVVVIVDQMTMQYSVTSIK